MLWEGAFDEADNLIWDLWCINSWISTVSADNKVHKKESLCASWWGHRMCARSTYWSGSVFLGGSSSGRRRCGSKFPFLPLELDASSTNKHRMSCLLFFVLMTPNQPHVAHALAKSSKEFKSVTNTCRSWCKKHWLNHQRVYFSPQLPISLKTVSSDGICTFLDSSSWWRPTTTSSPRPDRKTYMKILAERERERVGLWTNAGKGGGKKARLGVYICMLTSLHQAHPLSQWWWQSG